MQEDKDLTEILEELEELPDLPREAFADVNRHEISDDWLATASPEEQISAIVDWFYARFEDPANGTPYMSSEGGYIWVHGGPYDASEQMQERFSDIVPYELIEFAAEHVVHESSVWDWAPTQLTYYREEEDIFVEDKDLPLQMLGERLDRLLEVLTLQGTTPAVNRARDLAYAGVISALETFLWETVAFWVDHDDQTVRDLIKKHPKFKEQKFPVGSIFGVYESLAVRVKSHMQRMTWHRWDDARSLIEHGLGIKAPSFAAFEAPTQKRHDVVHRSGHDTEGNPVTITEDEVHELAGEVRQFAVELHRLIDLAKTPPQEAFDGAF